MTALSGGCPVFHICARLSYFGVVDCVGGICKLNCGRFRYHLAPTVRDDVEFDMMCYLIACDGICVSLLKDVNPTDVVSVALVIVVGCEHAHLCLVCVGVVAYSMGLIITDLCSVWLHKLYGLGEAAGIACSEC